MALRYSDLMPVHIVAHPVVQDALAVLRLNTTNAAEFRRNAARLTMALAVEATKALPMQNTSVETVLGKAPAQRIDDEIVVVPVLRAGLSMLEPILTLLPTARVGYIGIERDEQTAIPSSYYSKLPDQIASAHILLVDPMLATGGSAVAALDLLSSLGVSHAVLLSIVATDQGIRVVENHHSRPTIYTAAVDPTLNEQKYIVPGLGDFGDRLYGTD